MVYCSVLDSVLDEVRNSRRAALVVRGEGGIGKTALLEYLFEAASGSGWSELIDLTRTNVTQGVFS
jgi:hypothetical protein